MPGEIPADVVDLIHSITDEIINPIIGVIFAAALVYFLWGLVVFIVNSGDSAKRAEGKQHMLWGLIGLTIMLSVIAIIEIGLRTIGVNGSEVPSEIPVSI